MSNRRRNDYPGALHHVVNRGTAQTMIYRSDADRRSFLALVAALEPDYGIRVLAFVLMGNHYHLLLESTEGRLSAAMQHLDGRYATSFNRRHERNGTLFQGRFRSERIEDEVQLARTGIYIHLNPVRAGLVARPGDWRWSSMAAHARGRTPLPWLHLDLLGTRSGPEYLDDVVGHATDVEGMSRDPDPAAALAWTSPVDHEPALTKSDHAVALAFGMSVDELYALVRGRRNPARLVAIVLAAQVSALPVAAIAARYGLTRPSSVRTARRRLRSMISEDSALGQLVAGLGLDLTADE
ncbi:MAG: transposase [Actinomycetota bacterium]